VLTVGLFVFLHQVSSLRLIYSYYKEDSRDDITFQLSYSFHKIATIFYHVANPTDWSTKLVDSAEPRPMPPLPRYSCYCCCCCAKSKIASS